MECTWERTQAALGDLENLLLCGICRQLVQNPKSLGNCEHFFCSPCIEKSIGQSCPECGMPSHAKDACTNRQLETAVGLCQTLSFLLLKDSLNLPDTPTPSQNAANEKKPRRDRSTPESPCVEVKIKVNATFPDSTSSTPQRKRSVRVSTKTRNSSESSTTTVVSKKVKKEVKGKAAKPGPALKVPTGDVPHGRTRRGPRSESVTGEASSSSDHPSTHTTKTVKAANQSAGTVSKASRRKLDKSPPPAQSAGPAAGFSTPMVTPVRTGSRSAGPGAGFSTPMVTPVRTGSRSAGRGHGDRLSSPFTSSGSTPVHAKKNAKGETPLHVAVIKGDYDKVQSLIEEGAEVNTKDNAGWTPLHEACNHGFVLLVELLLDSGAFVNVPGGDNETPLHDAVLNNKVDIAALLVSRGADKHAKNLSGKVPRDLARTDTMREALDATHVDSQLDTSMTTVPSQLAVGPVVMLATGLSREERARVQKCATLLHGRMVTDFCPEVTHLVTSTNREGQCPRTLKFLQSVLMGKWIVNKDWVDMCLEYGERVSEEAFEVPGCSTNPDGQSPQNARLNAAQQLPGLFDGCYFFLHGAFSYPTPSKGDLTDLILQGGGKLVTRIPKADTMEEYAVTVPYHAKPDSTLSHCSHYIVTDTRGLELDMLHPRLCRTTATWVMDAIARFELVKPDTTM